MSRAVHSRDIDNYGQTWTKQQSSACEGVVRCVLASIARQGGGEMETLHDRGQSGAVRTGASALACTVKAAAQSVLRCAAGVLVSPCR